MNGDNSQPFCRSTEPASVWSRARKATTRSDVTWSFEDRAPNLTIADKTINEAGRRSVMATLRRNQQKSALNRLISLPNQGKVIECVATSDTNSHFITDGAYTRFADWRFIHRARLNLVPLNANKRGNDVDPRCRRCGFEEETLPHVINHCMQHSHAFQLRHNNIVNRIKKTAVFKGYRVAAENQCVGGSNLRPDLLLVRGTSAVIVDVTVSFENRLEALAAARAEKINKYSNLAKTLNQTYENVTVQPIVVGSLGCWHRDNDRFVNRICSRRYARTMRKLITSDTIQWSRDVYIEHITGVRQYKVPNQQAVPTAANNDAPDAPVVGPDPSPDVMPCPPTLAPPRIHNNADDSDSDDAGPPPPVQLVFSPRSRTVRTVSQQPRWPTPRRRPPHRTTQSPQNEIHIM